jgi:hypothetical protein
MSLDQEHRLEEVFSAARDLPPLEQAAFLDRACRGEMRLRPQVETLLRNSEPARGSAGKSVRPPFRRSGGSWLTAILLVLAGCTTYRTEPPKATADVPLLAPLQSRLTTRQELAKEWGPPSASLQQGRIVFYRLEGNGNRLRFSEETGRWRRARHSLVLIFTSTGLLEKSSLTRIR